MNHDIVIMGDICLDWYCRQWLSISFSQARRKDFDERVLIEELPGGTGLSFAQIAKDAGFNPMLLGTIGDDPSGHFIYDSLKQRGLERGVSLIPGGKTGRVFLAFDKDGSRIMIASPKNANSSLSVADIERYSNILNNSPILYVSGLCLADRQAPRATATFRALDLVKGNPGTKIVFDVVPHEFHLIYPEDEFIDFIANIDIVTSGVSTIRRIFHMGDRYENITHILARQTADRLKAYCNRFILHYGPTNLDYQLVFDSGNQILLRKTFVVPEIRRGFGDRTVLATLQEIFNIQPANRKSDIK